MVGTFSLAVFVILTFGSLYCATLKERIKAANPESAYQVGWQQGYLRAIQATNDAVVRKDTIALSEFEKVMAIDAAEFKMTIAQ